jgi:hypothetical protein
VDVLRQLQLGIGRLGGVVIVISRGNEHGRGNLPQTAYQLFACLVVCIVAVQQIAGEQHNIHALTARQGAEGAQQLTLLTAAYGGLTGGQALKGGVQMQVGAVENS